MTDAAHSTETLGQRLEDEARRMAARCVPDCPWAGPVGVLLDHLTSLPASFEGRFDRREVAPSVTAWDIGTSGGRNPRGATDGHRAVSPGRPLPSDVVERLRATAGPGAETVRVHDDEAADATAGAHRADAVTIGRDVFFRRGRFRPREASGLRLLVHETTHVLERLRPGASWRRATAGGVREEEAVARARAAAAVPGPASTPVPSRPAALAPPVRPASILAALPPAAEALGVATPSGPATASESRPMAATADPQLDLPAPAPVDLEAFRSGLLRDLMRQLRDEFERGG
jgi:hypothetical protein